MSASCCGAGYCASGNVCAEGSRCCPSDHPALHNGVCCPALAPSCGVCPASDPVDCLESHGICCTSARQCCRVGGKPRCCSPGDSQGAPGYFPGAGVHPKAPQVAPSTTPPATGEGCAPSSRQMGLGFGCNGDPGTPSSDGRRERVPVPIDRGGGGGTPLCGSAAEGGTVVLACSAGMLIREIVFASYGTPGGSCGNYSLGSCHATGSVEHVSKACLNKPSCSLPATNALFDDPCPSVTKRLFVEVRCGPALGRLEPDETSPWPLAPFGHGATQAAALFIIAVCATRRRRG